MNVSSRFVLLSALLVSAGSAGVFVTACSSGSNNPTDGGADAAKDVVVKKEAGPTPEAGPPDDSGPQQDPIVDPQCVFANGGDAGSAGDAGDADAGDAGTIGDAGGINSSCVVRDDAGTDCNPITNDGCDFADGGYSCDWSSSGFTCYNAPPNTAAVCAACDLQNGPACLPGETCVATDAGAQCARYCCADSDCAPGHCDLTTLAGSLSPAGVCVK